MIRVHVSLCLAGFCSVSLGCSNLAELVLHNLHVETAQDLDSCLEPVRDHLVASAAWQEVAKADPQHVYSAPYAQGFKDGYRDFIEEGGTGQPPPVPPSCYWDLRYQTPLGHAAIEDWYAGFRHGVAVAHESGNRRWVIVPSSQEALPVPHRDEKAIATPPAKLQTLPELPLPKKVNPDGSAGSNARDHDSTYSPIMGPPADR
jgi:hypothetical protein